MQIAGIRLAALAKSLRSGIPANATPARTETAQPLAGPGRVVIRLPLPDISAGNLQQPRPVVLPFPIQTGQQPAQEPARQAVQAYQAVSETAASMPVALAGTQPATVRVQGPVALPVRGEADRAAPTGDEAGVTDLRPMPMLGAVMPGLAWRLFTAIPKQDATAARKPAEARTATVRDAESWASEGGWPEGGWPEGGWTEALTLVVIVAAVCLGVWMLVMI